MKILRRLAIVCLVIGIGVMAAGLFVRSRARQVPVWYRPLNLDDATQHLAANSMNQKLLATYGAANDAVAAATRAKFPPVPVQPADLPPTPVTLQLSEAEINSFFAEWDNTEHWRQRLAKYVVDPLVVLEGHELILAGTVPDWNTVVSLHFEPKLENGKLDLGLKRVMVGTLVLPRSAIESYIAKIDALVVPATLRHRAEAEIGPKGWANEDAVEAAFGELITRSLHDQPVQPALMLREASRGHDTRSLPVKISAVDISNKTLTLSLSTMTPEEREALGQHLRGTDAPKSGVASN